MSLSTFNLRGSLLAAEAYRSKVSGFVFSYTGKSSFSGDPSGNWELQLLTSGKLTVESIAGPIDVFLVGGGGGGGGAYDNGAALYCYCGGGGGGGYTKTIPNLELAIGSSYDAMIGAGGNAGIHYATRYNEVNTAATDGGSSSFNGNSTSGGHKGNQGKTTSNSTRSLGGDGGSGGGGGAQRALGNGGSGGSNGGNGSASSSNVAGGKGQGTTTGKFGEASEDWYSTGGAGGGIAATLPGLANTGNGGGGGYISSASPGSYKDDVTDGRNGGSGIIIIRNARG